MPVSKSPLKSAHGGSCYHCTERHVGCHSDCERYLAWKKQQEKVNGTDEAAWEKRDLIYSYRNNNVIRNMRKAGKTIHEKR